jgi:hypothetical protein
MKTPTLFVLGALSALCLALAFNQAVAQEKEGAMRVVLKSVQVAPTKTDGNAWDVNDGKPDIMISVKNLSDTTQKEVVTDEKTDALDAKYDSRTVLVSPGHKLRILVEDKDAAVNDTIGNGSLDVTEEMVKKGTHTVTFGQVKSLTIEFQKPER